MSTTKGMLSAAELYEQLPKSTDKVSSPSMEPHKDVRSTAILVIDAPNDGSGRLVVATHPDVADASDERLIRIEHKPGTILCFPKGRVLAHFTEPINEGQSRLIASLNYMDSRATPEENARILEYLQKAWSGT